MKRTITVIGTEGYWRNHNFYLPQGARTAIGNRSGKLTLEWTAERPYQGHRWQIIVINAEKLLLLKGWDSVVLCREGWFNKLGLPEHGYVTATFVEG